MTTESEGNSLIDQIACETIALLSEQDEFDVRDLVHFEQLLRSHNAVNSKQVVDVLCARGERPE